MRTVSRTLLAGLVLTPNALASHNESETLWFSVRVSPINRFLKLLERASTLASEAMAASFTSRLK